MSTEASRMAVNLVSIELRVPESEHRGRAFFPLGALQNLDVAELSQALGEQFVEAEDVERLHLLKRALALPSVTFETYRGETPPYELHAYVRANEVSDAPIFATVLAPMPVVQQLVATPPNVVFETATLQVISEEPTSIAIVSALESWAKRIWPEMRVPRINLSPWPGPTEWGDGSLEILRLFPLPAAAEFVGVEADMDVSPSPNLVAPEFLLDEEAA